MSAAVAAKKVSPQSFGNHFSFYSSVPNSNNGIIIPKGLNAASVRLKSPQASSSTMMAKST
jgi:hypothetical protein